MKIEHGMLVMAADGKKALLFRNEGDEKYSVLQTLTCDQIANPRTGELGSDRPGRSFSSTGTHRSGYEETDWHRQAEDRFASRVANFLDEATRENDANLIIAAAPQFLGSLREHLSVSVKRRLRAEINKDLVHHETDEIARLIGQHVEKGSTP